MAPMRTLVGCWILVLPVLQEGEEVFSPPLLEETHQRALDSLHLSRRDFADLAVPVDIGTGDLLEFKVASNIGVDENLREFTGRDDELGDEINGVIAIPTEVGRRSLIRTEFPIELLIMVIKE